MDQDIRNRKVHIKEPHQCKLGCYLIKYVYQAPGAHTLSTSCLLHMFFQPLGDFVRYIIIWICKVFSPQSKVFLLIIIYTRKLQETQSVAICMLTSCRISMQYGHIDCHKCIKCLMRHKLISEFSKYRYICTNHIKSGNILSHNGSSRDIVWTKDIFLIKYWSKLLTWTIFTVLNSTSSMNICSTEL